MLVNMCMISDVGSVQNSLRVFHCEVLLINSITKLKSDPFCHVLFSPAFASLLFSGLSDQLS